jgi:hypothetical protein
MRQRFTERKLELHVRVSSMSRAIDKGGPKSTRMREPQMAPLPTSLRYLSAPHSAGGLLLLLDIDVVLAKRCDRKSRLSSFRSEEHMNHYSELSAYKLQGNNILDRVLRK